MKPPVTSPRVLVVEDDAMVRGLLAKHLRRNGYQVAEASDAETVLNTPSNAYDLVLADVHLPGQSGVELARQLKSNDAEAPVVFLTGDTDERLAREALDEGAAGYLLKPFEFFELDAVMRTAMVLRPQQHVMPEADLPRRNVTSYAEEQRALAQFRAAIEQPERIVLREGRSTPRRSPVGWKAVAGVAAAIALSWFAGKAVFPNGEPVEQTSTFTTAAPQTNTIMVPYVVESHPKEAPRR